MLQCRLYIAGKCPCHPFQIFLDRHTWFMGLKVTQKSWLLLIVFSPPLPFHFSCPFFLSTAGHLLVFILLGKVLKIAFRIYKNVGLDRRRCRWVVEQDSHQNIWVYFRRTFALISGPLDWIVLILAWFKRWFPPANWDMCESSKAEWISKRCTL